MSTANVDHGSLRVAGVGLLLVLVVAGCGGTAALSQNPSPTSLPTPSASPSRTTIPLPSPSPSASNHGSAKSVFASTLHYQAVSPSGWKLSPAAGSRHYDEFRSSDGLSAIRIAVFDGSAVGTLGDMITSDLEGILAHDGAVIESQRDETLSNVASAHRIGYSIKSGGVTNYGVDVMTLSTGRGVLMTLLSNDPITPTVQASFDQMTDSLLVLP